MPRYYEFFAGGGMVRAGLKGRWKCVFANDFDANKVATYAANWGDGELVERDIKHVVTAELPGRADLAWASFPCQDLSCAGNGLGIGGASDDRGTRSGTFWAFVRLMRGLKRADRKPKLIVLENVLGLFNTNGGSDFHAVMDTLTDLGFRAGAVVIDARHFVPQSRPRVFVIGVAEGVRLPERVVGDSASKDWHPAPLIKAHGKLSDRARKNWIWFNLGTAPSLSVSLEDVVIDEPKGVEWHEPAETRRLLAMMSDGHRKKLSEVKRSGKRVVATLSLRMRPEGGKTVQRAELNFGGLAGCLRTPKGGGSRPRVLVVDGASVRTRLLSPKEAAALMGLAKQYRLPKKYDASFKVIGDGIAVPVVRFLRKRLLDIVIPPRRLTVVSTKKGSRSGAPVPTETRNSGPSTRRAIA